MNTKMLSRQRIGFAIGLIVGVAAAVAAVPPWLGSDSSPTVLGQSRPALFDENRPLGPDGAAITLEEALATSPIPIYRPNSPVASDGSIGGLWLRTARVPEVYIRYDSGLTVSIREADFSDGFKAFYQAEIDQGFPGRLITLDQELAFSTPGTGAGPGLDMQLGPWLVEVIGTERESEDDLLSLAQSIIDSRELGTWGEIGDQPSS